METEQKRTNVVVSVLAVICLFGLPAYGQYGGGSGTEADPYLIEDANDMQAIGADPNYWDAHFKLVNDINLAQFTGTEFNIIGNDSNAFTGVFDGNGHTISNFSYSSTGTWYIGLFGDVNDPNAEIKNLGLIDPNVDAGTGRYVGSLIGLLDNGTITDCNSVGGSVSGTGNCVGGLVGSNNLGTVSDSYATGSVTGINWYVGGLVGANGGTVSNSYASGSVSGSGDVGGLVGVHHGTVSNSYATGSVSGDWYVGGLVGYNHTTVSNSYATGDVNGTRDYVGGLVGLNSGTVSNSYATGSVSGDWAVGGLVGYNQDTVSNSYATGSVSGDWDVGGLIGYDYLGDYTKSFWDNMVNPGLNGIGNITDPNVIAKSTVEMQTLSTFVSAEWDFGTPVWVYYTGGYPRLAWEPTLPIGDLNHDGRVDFFDFAIFADHWVEDNNP